MRKLAFVLTATLVIGLSNFPGSRAPQFKGADIQAAATAPGATAQSVSAALKPGQTPQVNATPRPAAAPKLNADYGKLPVYFIPNQGQMDKQVAYYVQGKDKTLYFTEEGITFTLNKPAAKGSSDIESLSRESSQNLGSGKLSASGAARAHTRGQFPLFDDMLGSTATRAERARTSAGSSERWVVKLEFVGARKGVKPVSAEESGAVVSYFRGKPEDWKTGLRTSSKIVYPNLWPGIDLVYRGTVNRLKYEFIVHPGADPSKIRLAYRGVDSLNVDDSGRLNVMTPVGVLQDDVPVAYQEKDGRSVPISLAYTLDRSDAGETLIPNGRANPEASSSGRMKRSSTGELPDIRTGSYGFTVGAYDHSRTLVLDPAFLIYCGYIGSPFSAWQGPGIAVDSAGNAYIAGDTASTEATFPVAVGPDLTYNGGGDAFVAKVNSSGTALVYCGYIGGSTWDAGRGIAVDNAGNAYVTGITDSTEATFPVTVGPDLTYNGRGDAFVAKVNPSGTALVYCGYIGGSGIEGANGIAVDNAGNAFVAGETFSSQATFPVTVGPDLTQNGPIDGFVAKVNSSGTALVYCGYIGGWYTTHIFGIAVDSAGNAYVTGDTISTEATFPVAVGPDLTYNGGGDDAFVAKVNSSGTALVYCGYIGGSSDDYGFGIAVDSAGNAYVTGSTTSTEATFPVAVGPDLTYNGDSSAPSWDRAANGFVAKVNSSGTALVYCGYIGGSGTSISGDGCSGIAVDSGGNAYVIGSATSTEATFPVTAGPDLTYNGGFGDAFVAKVNSSGTALVYCGYIGGSAGDGGYGIAVDSAGNAYVVGITSSTEATFPVTVGPDLTLNGSEDVFVAKVSSFAPGSPHLRTPIPPIDFGNVYVGSRLDLTTTLTNDGDNTLAISAIAGSPWSAEFSFMDPAVPFSVAPGGSQALTVRFEPLALGHKSAQFMVHSNDPDARLAALNVSGSAIAAIGAPDIYLSSTSLAFGDVKVGSVRDMAFSIQNVGDKTLTIDSVTRISGCSDFSVVSYPSSLASGGLDSATLRFSPATPGGKSAIFEINSDDPDEPRVTFAVSGGGGFIGTSPSNHKILPEAIWAPASEGGTWVTDVQITDLTGGSIVSAYFSYGGGGRRGPIALWISPSKDNSAKFTNILSALEYLDDGSFTYYGKVGALDFVTQDDEHKIQVSARTSNGNYSKTLPGFNLNDANTVDSTRSMMIQYSDSELSSRLACGFYNPGPDPVTVVFTLLGQGRNTISVQTKSFAGYDFQAFDPDIAVGRHSIGVTLFIEAASGTGRLIGFGASADRTSNDPAAYLASQRQDGFDSSPSNYQVLPEAIWAPATAGGEWNSRIMIQDMSGGSVVSAYFNYGGGARRGPFNLWTGTAAGDSAMSNVLQTLQLFDPEFAYYGRVGAVEFFTQDASHLIRLMAVTSNGDVSKTLPAFSLGDSNTADVTRKMMIQDLPNTAMYRSSCGFFNPTTDSVTVEFRLIDRWGGTRGAAFTKTFVGHDFQAFNPYAEAGISAPGDFYDNMFLLINPISGAGKIMGFGASANNYSNDPAAHIAQQYQ